MANRRTLASPTSIFLTLRLAPTRQARLGTTGVKAGPVADGLVGGRTRAVEGHVQPVDAAVHQFSGATAGKQRGVGVESKR
jgi:hypothetical protein